MTSTNKNLLRSGIKCCIESCKKSKRHDANLRIFKFPPADVVIGQIWREKCGVKLADFNKKLYICHNHFPDSDVGKLRLKQGVVPSLNLPVYDEDYDFPVREAEEFKETLDATCSNCMKFAKSSEFYRKKYYDTLSKLKQLRKSQNCKKRSDFKIVKEIDSLNNVNKETKVFCKLLLSPRPAEYEEDVKALAQNIYYVSQSTYKFLRNKLNINLPHMSTVNRWAPIKSLQPGFRNSGFEFIKRKCSELEKRERTNVVLLMDEMTINSELRYNPKLDLVDGFEDKGFGRTDIIGKEITVFMLKSMFSSWGVVLNYFVSHSGLKSTELRRIIIENLNIAEELDIKIKVLICDQGSANRKCFGELGVSVENPFFFNNEDKVICLYDFPHLIKSLRNGWMKCDLETMDGIVSFKVVQELWEMEQGSTTRMCPKLTSHHIYPSPLEKMKVKLATQVLSHTVQAAIKTVIETVGFKKNSKEVASCTASFIEKINSIVDCLNSTSLHSPNILKSALQFDNIPHKYIKNFKNYLEHIKFVDKKKRVYFLDGMKLTINGVLLLVEELLKHGNDTFFIMTRSLNQDKLENCFSVLRQKGGNNRNPSVADVNNILARLMTAKIVQQSSQSNCEEMEDNTLEILHNILTHPDTEAPCMALNTTSLSDDQENDVIVVDNSIDEFPNTENITTDLVSLRYFLGYVAFKILPKLNCQQCSSVLRKEEEILSAPSELFIYNKNYSSLKDFGSLIAPSEAFFKVSKVHVNIFEKMFKLKPQIIGIKQIISEKCLKATPSWFATCLIHKRRIMEFIILILIRKNASWVTSENHYTRSQKLKILCK